MQTTLDPEISEWGNPAEVKLCPSRTEYIGPGEQTGGSETSQYPLERESKRDFLSSGERNGKSLNQLYVKARVRCAVGVEGLVCVGMRTDGEVNNRHVSRMALGKPTKEGDSPVGEA